MARATRHSRRQAARIGLLAALWGACASMPEPPGGPPDFSPPVILSVTPDSGAVVDGFEDAVVIRFDEVINERSGSGLENLILLSPRAEEVEVSWKRKTITVKPKEGWRPGVVYHVTLLPGFMDLRNNRLDSSRTIIFSTGGPIPDTRLDGTVVNWEAGRAAPGALVEALLLPDSLVWWIQADSAGDFELGALPVGRYLLTATVDRNSNRLRDLREPFDSVSLQLDSTVSQVLWTFAHDSTGPQIRAVAALDSVTIRVRFSQMLAPGEPGDSAVQVFALPDTVPVALEALWSETVYDSVRAVEAAIADSTRQAEEAERVEQAEEADSVRIEAPAVADTTARVVVDSAMADTSTVADTSRIDRLLVQRPKLSADWFVRLASGVTPGARYLVVVRARNVSGAMAESQDLLIIPARPDST